MEYSLIGIIAIIIHIIINPDCFRKEEANHLHAEDNYRIFLYSVIAYHVTDACWGFFNDYHLRTLLYLDTVVYFTVMALSVLLWTEFAIRYLGEKNKFSRILNATVRVFFIFQIAALVINFFKPIMFYIDGSGEYHASAARYIAFLLQILMFLMTSIYTLVIAFQSEGTIKRRHTTVGVFGIIMIFAVAVQIAYPLFPMYSSGYLVALCLLHTFVVEDERIEFGLAKHLAYTDALTGVKNQNAYTEAEKALNKDIAEGKITEFAVVVFDINDLKLTNDTMGHESGDNLIKDACSIICDIFSHSPVFRIGGDEFTVILKKRDYARKAELMDIFHEKMEENIKSGGVVIPAGLAEYDPSTDRSLNDVFKKADKIMYAKKSQIKDSKPKEIYQ